MHADDYAPTATMADAHAEWHRNTGVPMGTPGCPQDACHPVDDDYGTTTYLDGRHVRMVAALTGRALTDALIGTETGDLGCSSCEIGMDHDEAAHAELVAARVAAVEYLAARAAEDAARWARIDDEPPF